MQGGLDRRKKLLQFGKDKYKYKNLTFNYFDLLIDITPKVIIIIVGFIERKVGTKLVLSKSEPKAQQMENKYATTAIYYVEMLSQI